MDRALSWYRNIMISMKIWALLLLSLAEYLSWLCSINQWSYTIRHTIVYDTLHECECVLLDLFVPVVIVSYITIVLYCVRFTVIPLCCIMHVISRWYLFYWHCTVRNFVWFLLFDLVRCTVPCSFLLMYLHSWFTKR